MKGFRNYRPPGPVAAAFIADQKHTVQTIRGPVGGGKTVAKIFKHLNMASRVMPVCKDGIIHFKVAVAGATYGQLERNLYPTWHYWLPKDGGDWTEGEWAGGRGRFAEHRLKFDVLRGDRRVMVDFHAIFAAIGELSVEQFVRGFEPSAWDLFEMDLMPEGIVEQSVGRLGRFPNKDMLPEGIDWRGYVAGDLNSPDIDSWYYELAEELRPEGMREYVQPAGTSPLAENLQNLPPSYYANLMHLNGHKKRWLRRFVLNQYGPSSDGDPVYEDSWSDETHLAREELRATKGRTVDIGIDQGLRPAALITQRQASGQDWVLGEVVPGRMSARRFAVALIDELHVVAPGCLVGNIWADLAGFTGADQDDGELAWCELLQAELAARGIGAPVMPAPSNSPDVCITAVEDELLHMVAANTPALLLSPRCKQTRKGFASEYKYEKRPDAKDQVKRPIKNLYANPHNALQYKYVGEKGRHGVIAGPRDPNTDQRRAMRGQAPDDSGCTVMDAPVNLG